MVGPELAVHAAFSTAEVIFATIGGLRGAISLILAQVGLQHLPLITCMSRTGAFQHCLSHSSVTLLSSRLMLRQAVITEQAPERGEDKHINAEVRQLPKCLLPEVATRIATALMQPPVRAALPAHERSCAE